MGRATTGRAALLACTLALAGCGLPYDRPEQANYRQGFFERGFTVEFVPGTAEPQAEDLQALADLRAALPPDARVRLALTGDLAVQRAARVEAALGRPIVAERVGSGLFGGLGRNEADLVVLTPGIVPDACDQPPARVGRTLWVIGDYSRQQLLPPGCAVATMIMEQAADRRDVLRGRVLEPGAAGPMARAADRYLRRNDERARTGDDRGGGGRGAGEEEQQQQGGPQQGGPGSVAPPGAATGLAPAGQSGALPPASPAASGSGSATAPAR